MMPDDIRPADGESWSAAPFRFDDGTVKAMLGGVMDGRPLMTEGPYGLFEQTVERVLGARIRDCVTGDDAIDLYRALVNVNWRGPHGALVAYSMRAAGDLAAAVRRVGDYCLYSWNGQEGTVRTWIEVAMALEGWGWEVDNS